MTSKPVVATSATTSLTGTGLLIAQIVGSATGTTPTNVSGLIASGLAAVLGFATLAFHLNTSTQGGSHMAPVNDVANIESRLRSAWETIKGAGFAGRAETDLSGVVSILEEIESVAAKVAPQTPAPASAPASAPAPSGSDFSSLTS